MHPMLLGHVLLGIGGVLTDTMPVPQVTLLDSTGIMANSFVTVGWLLAAVAVFIALGFGFMVAPRLIRLAKGALGGGGGGKGR